MQTQIRVYTLGRFAIERDGQVLENFLSTKTGVLFTYLAMNPGEHSRDKLAALFWSETNDEQSLKNLRTVLSSLRRQLDDVLDVSRKSLAIRDDADIWVDARAFEDARELGIDANGAQDRLQAMRELAALYQGPFLSTVKVRDAEELDQWISVTQNRLAQLHRELLADIVDSAIEQGNTTVGLQYVRELIVLDPLWETPRRQHMRLLAHSDRLSEALVQYEQFARLLDDELGVTPDEETTRLYEQLRSGAAGATPRKATNTIASPDMLFVEPVEDVEFAQRMLNAPQCRLLTIYGISGIGKTALASQIAYQRQHLYRDGARLVPLTLAQSASSVPLMVARALQVEVAASATPETVEDMVLDYLRDRHMLLVLDNYEHLLPDTAFVERVLNSTTDVQIVVASQNPLNLFSEWLLPLRGLLVPDGADDDAETYEAVRLFELTAQRLNPRFNVADVLPSVVRICQLVDGLPLGIILAAGWTQVLPVSKIAESIAEGMEFNISYQRTLPERHQSIEVMLEHTWNTLDVTQQQILKSLSVFEGAFGLNVFMSLCDAPMDAFFGLIQKSLILKYDEMYRMHQLIGRYARQKLFFDPDKDALSARYLDHYSAYIHDLRQRALPVHEYLVAIEVEYPNIWNFRWMSGAFQPVYALSMSRFLMVYWEISHSVSVEDVIKVLRQFETNMQTLDARWHGLLYLQLARLHQHADQSEDALTYRARAFDLYCCNDQWLDHAVLYSLFAMSLNGAEATVISGNTEMRILTSVYFNLILMNLDMHDFQTTGDLLAQLRGSMTDDAGRVALYGAQAALAAAQARYADACDLYREANNVPAVESQALLRSMIAGSLLRLAFQLGRDDLFEPVLVNLLTDTARQPTSAALANVLDFCRQIRDENAGSPFGALVNRALQSLSPDVRQQPQVAAFLAG